MKPKVLLTGNKGFIGSNLEKRLLQEDIELYTIDLKNGQDIRYCKLPEKCDIIYHLAAKASIPYSWISPEESHTNNVGGTLRILEYARKTKARVIFSSSSSVYDLMSPYAIQKKQCEDYLKFYWNFGIKSTALRYFNVFGESQELANEGESLVLARFLKQKKEKKPLTVVESGKQRRDFVYVGDVVEANLRAAKWLEEASNFEFFDIGTGKSISINELADYIDYNKPRDWLPAREEPFESQANGLKAKILLNWMPTITIQEWLKRRENVPPL